MSRTDNTMPYRIQKEDRPSWTAWNHYGGCYARIGRWTRPRESSARVQVRIALARGEQPDPTRHRGSAKWDRW